MGKRPIQWPIVAYVGANGDGKTLAMTEDLAMPARNRHTPCDCGECDGVPLTILANYRVDSTNFVALRSWSQLVTAHNAIVLLDEITAVLPSRQAMTVPPQLQRVLNQLRKAQCLVGWTGPAWARADTLLREVTQEVAVCRGYLKDGRKRQPGRHRFPIRGPVARGPGGERLYHRSWPPKYLFSVTYYDARAMDEFSYGDAEGTKADRHRWYWRPGHEAHEAYRTLEGVDLLDHLDDVGACFTCGGYRARRKCECALESPFGVESPVGAPVDVGSVAVAGKARRRAGGPRAPRVVGGGAGGELVGAVAGGVARGAVGPGSDGVA